MGRHYGQLSLEERCTIAHLYKDGQSIRKIAADLDRAPSTVARELNRNSRQTGRRQAGLRPRAGPRPAMDRLAPGARCRAARARPRPAPARLVARADRRPAAPAERRHNDQPRKHLPLHLRPGPPHQRWSLAPLPAPRPIQATPAGPTPALLRRSHKAPCVHRFALSRRRTPHHLRPLGSRPHDVRRPRPGSPRQPRTEVQAHRVGTATRQGRATRRKPAARLVCSPRHKPAQIRHLRQRHRVRPALSPQRPARHPHILLRPTQSLAEGLRREHHRPPAKVLASQHEPRHHKHRQPRQPRRRSQQHASKVPRLQNSC